MLRNELDEAISIIERYYTQDKRNKKFPELSKHRWSQILRILKFYRLRWDELDHDSAWSWRQDHPISPYFIRGGHYTLTGFDPNFNHGLTQHYKENPEQCIEPPTKEIKKFFERYPEEEYDKNGWKDAL